MQFTTTSHLRFSWLSLVAFGASEQDMCRHRVEMNNFLRVVFALVHRNHEQQGYAQCLFLQDILAFLEVEHKFSEQIEQYLRLKCHHLDLHGWRAFTHETYGVGIPIFGD